MTAMEVADAAESRVMECVRQCRARTKQQTAVVQKLWKGSSSW